ncbi:Zn-ribbon domain-containing OB-fold protein [Novosphingobium lindaniclasticum]|uniref:DUF35 domain-containing protein n=1 Tax=Novosphingobium lindaniclasticum LE124 TaxID=1096930 RepID=T0HQB5_9SPHN|nr:OB-fold domain-containing protein [Novosphingobium lindaniclasticum]EQB14313.1 hypothetical protein L284_13030 [Novosphingobium lindaniclasticum LE124]
MRSETIAPTVNDLNRPFWEAGSRGSLVLPRCLGTGRLFWPPAPVSPHDWGSVEWVEVTPVGTVRSLCVYRRAFQQAFAPLMPYGIAMVAVKEAVIPLYVPGTVSVDPGQQVRIGFEPLFSATADHGLAVPQVIGPA